MPCPKDDQPSIIDILHWDGTICTSASVPYHDNQCVRYRDHSNFFEDFRDFSEQDVAPSQSSNNYHYIIGLRIILRHGFCDCGVWSTRVN